MASSGSINWACVTCGRHLEDLYVIPCQHRFCDTCLNSWLVVYIDHYRGSGGQIPCQICWSVWKLPVNGLEALKQNYSVHLLQSQLRDFTMATDDNETTSSPSNNYNPFLVDSGTTNEDDISDAPKKADYFVSAHSYQNESIPSIIISPVNQETSMGTGSAICQSDIELDNTGTTVIHENIVSSTRFFHGNNPGGPSVGVCRRIEHYHDYDMYGTGHFS